MIKHLNQEILDYQFFNVCETCMLVLFVKFRPMNAVWRLTLLYKCIEKLSWNKTKTQTYLDKDLEIFSKCVWFRIGIFTFFCSLLCRIPFVIAKTLEDLNYIVVSSLNTKLTKDLLRNENLIIESVARVDLVISITLQGHSFSTCSHKPVWIYRDKRKFEFGVIIIRVDMSP